MEPTRTLSDMAPRHGRSPFRLTHCMTEGQMTPPSSPTVFPSRRRSPVAAVEAPLAITIGEIEEQ